MKFLLLLSFFISFNVFSYPAYIDYFRLQQGSFNIVSESNTPLACTVRVGRDKAFFEIAPLNKQTIKIKNKIQMHDISLFCKKIKKITKTNTYVKNIYKNQLRKNEIIFH